MKLTETIIIDNLDVKVAPDLQTQLSWKEYQPFAFPGTYAGPSMEGDLAVPVFSGTTALLSET